MQSQPVSLYVTPSAVIPFECNEGIAFGAKGVTMSISKRKNGTYNVEVYFEGKRIAMKRGFKNKTEAKLYHDEMKSKHRQDPIIAINQDFTFEQLVVNYEAIHLPKVRVGTKDRYKIDIDLRLKPTFSRYKLRNITAEMVMAYQTELLKTLKPKSVNNCIALLGAIFNFGIVTKMTKDNPCRLFKPIKVAAKTFNWWDKWDDVQKFLTATVNEPLSADHFQGGKDPYAAAYRLALECGMRLGEVVGLSKQGIDFERGQIMVHRQWLVKEMDYGPVKHNKVRTIGFDVNSDLARMLKAAVKSSKDPEVIFVTLNGERVRSDKLSGFYFAAWIEKLGLPTITFHDLRHTFASWFMIRGGSIWELMEILGHNNISTTMRYAHLSSKIKVVPSFDNPVKQD